MHSTTLAHSRLSFLRAERTPYYMQTFPAEMRSPTTLNLYLLSVLHSAHEFTPLELPCDAQTLNENVNALGVYCR